MVDFLYNLKDKYEKYMKDTLIDLNEGQIKTLTNFYLFE